MLSFTADTRAYYSYTKRIDFFGVSLGCRGQGWQLNILEDGRKGGHMRGARSPLTLLLR